MVAHPLVTVIVVPREGFRIAPRCLALLLERTSEPYAMVYVDAGSPRSIAKQVQALLATHGGTLVRTDRYLRPTRARNLGLEQVTTPYTVFLDNDVIVGRGWLGPLVDCANETGADFVSPLIYEGDEPSELVHFAGGDNRVEPVNGQRQLIETYRQGRFPTTDLERRETELAEFHAVLVRTDAVRRVGGLDERFPTAFEHNDLCLSLAERGGRGWLEPRSVVRYVIDRPTARSNVTYHAVRWSRRWIRESLDGMCAKWQIHPNDPSLGRSLPHLHHRRRRPFCFVRSALRRTSGLRGVAVFDRLADAGVDAFATWLDRTPPRITLTTWRGV